MKPESEYLAPIKSKTRVLPDFPYNQGDKFGNVTIIDNDYSYHHKRWQVRLQCDCGKIRYVRWNVPITSDGFGCRDCRGYNFYPEFRDNSRYFTEGIHGSWISLSKCTSNLNRGSRILEHNVTLFDLREQFDKQNGKCIYTGIPLEVIGMQKTQSNASIDRKDSNQGYIKDNIQWVYKPINIMKNNLSDEEFKTLCNQVANFTRQL